MWKYEIWLNMKNQPYLFLPQPLHAPHSSLFSKKKRLHGLQSFAWAVPSA